MKRILYRSTIQDNRGATLTIALVFLGIFLMLTTTLLSYVQLEIQVSERTTADAQAFAAAEAGIEYYRWHLAHAPNDVKDGTNEDGPYTHLYRDAEGTQIGSFTLEITPKNFCNGSTEIRSRGTSAASPARSRTIAITYGTPALTKYSFLTNSNIWFGGTDELKGPVHANGGIRMDAPNKSRMTSAKATYICGSEHGCNPPQTKPGIWGSGGGSGSGLWDFPTAVINFDTIALNLRPLRDQATAAQTYFSASNTFGYHAKLNENGTVNIFKVMEIKPKIWGYDGRTGWVETAENIQNEVLVRTITLPEANDCGTASLLFFEDTLWVDGVTKRPVTLVAGRLSDTAPDASIIINGSLVTPSSGNAGALGSIGLIAQKDVLIPLQAPSQLALDAALFAQKGHVFRNYYCADERLNRYGYKCNATYGPYVLRDTLTLKGTVVTNQIAAWTWVDEQTRVISGYRGGDNIYDTDLIFNPPPFFPTQGTARILTWQELNQ